jgi:hypothetical protein
MSEENPKMCQSCFFNDKSHLLELTLMEVIKNGEDTTYIHVKRILKKAGLDLDNREVKERLSSCRAVREAVSNLVRANRA